MPDLSVIVPTLQYPFVDAVVAGLMKQSAPAGSYEVVIADSLEGRWADAIHKEALENPDVPVVYLRSESLGLWRSRSLNAGIKASGGRLVVLLAGDFARGRDFVETHRQFHAHNRQREGVAVACSSFVAEQKNGPLVQWLESSGTLFGDRMEPGDAQGFFYAGNVSLKREFLLEAGLFDEDFPYDSMDDFELGERLRHAGMISYFLPDGHATHQHEEEVTLAERRLYLRRAGESAAVFEKKHPGPYGWSKSCARPPWRLELDAFLWGAVYFGRCRAEDLHRFYSARLDAAFVRGWRRGRGA